MWKTLIKITQTLLAVIGLVCCVVSLLCFSRAAHAGPIGPNTFVQLVEQTRVRVSEEFLICPEGASYDHQYGNTRCETTVHGLVQNAWLPLRLYTQVGYRLVYMDPLTTRYGGVDLVLYWEPTAAVLAADKLKHGAP